MVLLFSALLDPDAKSRAIQARGDLANSEKNDNQFIQKKLLPQWYILQVSMFNVIDDLLIFEKFLVAREADLCGINKGHIVTNYHVIEGAQKARVTFADHSVWDARLVGAEADKDIAVLKIEAPAGKIVPPANRGHRTIC